MDLIMIKEILNYMEVMEELHDEFRGESRSFPQLFDDGHVPDLYNRLKILERNAGMNVKIIISEQADGFEVILEAGPTRTILDKAITEDQAHELADKFRGALQVVWSE